MNRSDFEILTRGAIAEIISWASLYLCQVLPNENIRLISYDSVLAETTDEAVEYLVSAVFRDEDDIKPCIDLVVIDFDDTTVTIMYMGTGHSGKPFGLNWTGTAGPYIKAIDGKLLQSKCNDKFPDNWGKP
jgi:hypothetical protein